MAETMSLHDGGSIYYDAAFFGADEANAYFAALRAEVPWKQERGRTGPFPRLTAWYADAGMRYTYSGVTHHGLEWTPTLTEIKRRIEPAAGCTFNSLLLNLYRDGQDSVGFHADDEPELGQNPVIGSMSVGAAREFVLRHKKTREKRTFTLAHGSLLIMGGMCQHYWIHGVPKTKKDVGERINLTFRKLIDKDL